MNFGGAQVCIGYIYIYNTGRTKIEEARESRAARRRMYNRRGEIRGERERGFCESEAARVPHAPREKEFSGRIEGSPLINVISKGYIY